MRVSAFSRASALPVALFLAACASGPADNGRCAMAEAADMTVLNDHGVPIVKVGINGQPAAFVVDSGASASTVTPEAVDRFALPVDMSRSGRMTGVGGTVFVYPVNIERLDLGTAAARQITLMQAGSFGHATVDGLPVSGLFGADFLANYDVEFDLPAHHVSLYQEQACNGDFAQPWDGFAYREPFRLEEGNKITLPVKLDGAATSMVLDSGASGTIVDDDTATAAGVPPAARANDRKLFLHGIDDNRLPAAVHRFATLAIGPDTLNGPWIGISDILSPNLLGANFLRTHRVWVSYPHEVMWVQPVGHVQLVEPGPAPKPATPPPRAS